MLGHNRPGHNLGSKIVVEWHIKQDQPDFTHQVNPDTALRLNLI